MAKWKKRLIASIVTLAILGGLGTGGYYIWKGNHTEVIEVFPVANVAEQYWGDNTSVSGNISSGKEQSVMLREGLIDHINVKEGDSVSKGDVLLVYDTTSFQLVLQSDEARIAVMESNIERKKEEISKYYTLKPSEWAPKPTEKTIDHGALKFTKSTIDVGTKSLPDGAYGLLFRIQPGIKVTSDFLKWLRKSGKTAEIQLYEGETMFGSYILDGSQLPQPETRIIDDGEPDDSSKEDSSKDDSSDDSSGDDSSGDDSSGDDSSGDDSSGDDSSGDDSSDDSSSDDSSDDSSDSSSEPESEPDDSSDDSSEESVTPDSVGAGTRFGKMKTVTIDPLDDDWDPFEGLTFTGDGVMLDMNVRKHNFGQLITCTPMTYERYETIYIDNFPENAGENYMYSKKDLAEMAEEAEKDLVGLQLDLRELNLTYEKDKLIGQTGEVKAEIDGSITQLGDPSALSTGDTLLTVKGNENYTLTLYISEMRLASMEPGLQVTAFSYESGNSFTATIDEIGTTPLEGSYGWNENPNNSYFPVFAKVDDPEIQMSIGEYCEVTLPQTNDSGVVGFFIPRFCIRKDDSGSYVMKTDENGLLKKQYVKTGRILWGEQIEILAGLSQEDHIAFPYGKTVREGAATKQVDYPSY